jgi:hypothetical protein
MRQKLPREDTVCSLLLSHNTSGTDTAEFGAACRALKVTVHLARNESRAGGSALDRTARQIGYAVSQRVPSGSKRSLAG